MSRDAIPPGPRPGMPLPAHLPVDMRDLRSLREDVLEVRDEGRAHRREVNAKLAVLDRIARATFEELSGRDAATIPGVTFSWSRVLRQAALVLAIGVVAFLASCAGARAGDPHPTPRTQGTQ